MRLQMTPILLTALVALASCAAPTSDPCAGWRPIRLLDPTVDLLAASDPQALQEIVAHYEFGRRRTCW